MPPYRENEKPVVRPIGLKAPGYGDDTAPIQASRTKAASIPTIIVPPANSRDVLLSCVPRLRAFARMLCLTSAKADDLVQQTLIEVWADVEQYPTPSALLGRLFRTLRRSFYSAPGLSTASLEASELCNGIPAPARLVRPSVGRLSPFSYAVGCLPAVQREALALVICENMPYADAAAICSCSAATMKSRVSGGLQRLGCLACAILPAE